MEILIALTAVILIAFAVTAPSYGRNPAPVKSVDKHREKINDIYILLQNIETYDGSPKGQKKLGGDI
jgi:hypothetical protein